MYYRIGPGAASSVIRALIWANVATFIVTSVVPSLTLYLGLAPVTVFEEGWIWQPVTYMFLHGSLFHILFNMLALWMFGTELERLWGTRFFFKYYLVTGVGAGITTLAVSLLPTDPGTQMYYSVTVGASGAIYGLLLAYALSYPDRPIYMYLLFPIPAKYFVLIIGGIAFCLFSQCLEWRGGPRRPPRRPRLGLPVPQGRPHRVAVGNQVSLPAMENGETAQEVHCSLARSTR